MVRIRKSINEEASILWNIQKQAFLPLYEKYHDKANPYLRGIEDITRRIESSMFRYYTILEDDKIVGGIVYRCRDAGEYYLQRVYIKPERQGKRIAQTAILLCENEFEDATCFTVDFPQDLEKNRRCYEKAGFCDTGRREEAEPGVVLAFYKKSITLEQDNV